MKLSCNITASDPSRLARQLKTHVGYFDKIRVILLADDNDPLISVIDRYRTCDIEFYNSRFDRMDNVRNELCSHIKSGEFAFILDDDLILSQILLDNLYVIYDKAKESHTSVSFPVMYEMGNEYPESIGLVMEYAELMLEAELRAKYNRPDCFYYTWQGAYLVDEPVKFGHPAHPCPTAYPLDACFCSTYPIIHVKKFGEMMISPIWIAIVDVLNGINWGVDDDCWNELRQAIYDSDIHNKATMQEKFKQGDISQSLKDWMIKYHEKDDYHCYCWFALYYLHYHPEELPEGFFNEFLFNRWIWYHAYSLKEMEILSLPIKRELKEHLLKLGYTKICNKQLITQ